ncbi:MAG: ABC transporter permease [Peptoniphilus sp.]|nr:ABC transporter permease [Peptoniphilus sp.]
MGIFENIKVAFSGLLLNKIRSFLTMLGIIIGISSVIGIVTIGKSLSETVADGFSQFNNAAIYVGVQPKEGYNYQDIMYDDEISMQQIEKVKERYSSEINAVSMYGPHVSGVISAERDNVRVEIVSTVSGELELGNLNILAGRFLNDDDVDKSREIAVISDKVLEKVFENDANKALGSTVEIDAGDSLRMYRVVGIYKYEPINMGVFGGQSGDDPTSVYIPISVGNAQFYGDDRYWDFYVSAKENTQEAVETLSAHLTEFFNEGVYKENERTEIGAHSLQSQIAQAESVMSNVKLAIGAIAAISLLVGGIGVMNILLVSVTERTREIGIRKALGATNVDIRSQFIIESIIICVVGGIFGIILGAIIGYVGSSLMKQPTLPSVSSVIIAVGFSMAVGIFFGYYPANKAAKLDPIDALRYE